MGTGSIAQRGLAAALVACLVVLTCPRGAWPRGPASAKACGTGTATCCCGVASGCRICPTEQATPAQRQVAMVLFTQAGCSGPVRDTAAPDSPKYLIPTSAAQSTHIMVARLIVAPSRPRASVDRTPDPPPPRPLS